MRGVAETLVFRMQRQKETVSYRQFYACHMVITYTDEKKFTKEQTQRLFLFQSAGCPVNILNGCIRR